MVTPKLPPGTAPGFAKLPAQTGVYRCKLFATRKRRPEYADYAGRLRVANGTAQVLIWLHSDGTLGLRLEKIVPRKPQN
jgi:hypothetical protein